MRLALCLLLLSSAVVLGQSQPQNNSSTAVSAAASLHLLRPYGTGCPVAMRAEREASGQREWVVSLEDALPTPRLLSTQANRAGVRVELVGFTGKAMTQAEIAVYYLPPSVRALPASQYVATPAKNSDLKKTFILSAGKSESNLRLTGNLLVGNAASITRVRLLRIEYSDGSSWQTKSDDNCTVEPGLLLAVTTGR